MHGMHGMGEYQPPLSLTVLVGIFLILGGLCGLIILGDIIWRRGWKSMMIPTYPITATYMGPLGLYLYFKYGRAADPKKYSPHSMHHQHPEQKVGNAESNHAHDHHGHENGNTLADHSMDHANHDDHQKHEMSMHDIHMHEMEGPSRPTWVTVLIGVSHCGAGCVLGDLVGEWLVYGTGVTTNGKDLWPMLLIDYAFALLFGIFFQYFSIAPMSGDYGLKTLIRAAKADILSLTAFEIGLFGWMIAFHVGIWNYRLSMTTWTYWWMMQVGMFLGYWTATPINWWLITRIIKEPCA